MASPSKPSVPQVTPQDADTLVVDWSAMGGITYKLHARDTLGLSREIANAIPPTKIGGLFPNERYEVGIEGFNSDGQSSESDVTISWTNPISPQSPPVAYVSVRDGAVSIGWDLINELALVRHQDFLAIEVGRSDPSTPQVQLVGEGKLRDLCFDLKAPVGLLEYRLRLRANRPSPQLDIFSPWGPPTQLMKPVPNQSSRAQSKLDVSAKPLIGGQAIRSWARMLAAEEEEGEPEEDEDNGKSDSNSSKNESERPENTEGNHDGGAKQGEEARERKDGTSSGGGGSSERPSDEAAVDPNHFHPYSPETNPHPEDGGPIIKISIGGGYETKDTPSGTYGREAASYPDGTFRPYSEWVLLDPTPRQSASRVGSSPAAPSVTEGPATDAKAVSRPTGVTNNEFIANSPVRQAERSGPAIPESSNVKLSSLNSDHSDTRRPTPSSARIKTVPSGASTRKRAISRRRVAPNSVSLLDRFVSWLSSPLSHSPSTKPSSTKSAKRSRAGGIATGTRETNQAIREAAQAYNLDFNSLRAIASIESSMDPTAQRSGSQFVGLYQFGNAAWKDFGKGGDKSNVRDNAMAAARMFAANARRLRNHFGREPTFTELYIAHQQGPGVYLGSPLKSKNVSANRYPGMQGPQTLQSFEAGWGAEIERRRRIFSSLKEPDAG